MGISYCGCFFKEILKLPLGVLKETPNNKIGKSFLLEGEVSFSEEKFSKLLLAGLVVRVHSFKYLLNTYVVNSGLSTGHTSVYKTEKKLPIFWN